MPSFSGIVMSIVHDVRLERGVLLDGLDAVRGLADHLVAVLDEDVLDHHPHEGGVVGDRGLGPCWDHLFRAAAGNVQAAASCGIRDRIWTAYSPSTRTSWARANRQPLISTSTASAGGRSSLTTAPAGRFADAADGQPGAAELGREAHRTSRSSGRRRPPARRRRPSRSAPRRDPALGAGRPGRGTSATTAEAAAALEGVAQVARRTPPNELHTSASNAGRSA